MSMESIARWFQEANFKWKFEDGYKVPNLEDLDEYVMRAIDSLSGAEDLTQMEFGRMIVQKNGQHFDVYVHMHEIPIPDA